MFYATDPSLLLVLLSVGYSLAKHETPLWKHAILFALKFMAPVLGVAFLVAFPTLLVSVAVCALAVMAVYLIFETISQGLALWIRLQNGQFRLLMGSLQISIAKKAKSPGSYKTRATLVKTLGSAMRTIMANEREISLEGMLLLLVPGGLYLLSGDKRRAATFLTVWLSLVAYGLLRISKTPEVGHLYFAAAIALSFLSLLYRHQHMPQQKEALPMEKVTLVTGT